MKGASGSASASEVVRTALRLLEEREQERAARIEQLRREIQKGLDSGAATPLDMEEIKRLAHLSDGPSFDKSLKMR